MLLLLKKISIFVIIFIMIYVLLYYFSNSYHERELSIYQLMKKNEKIKTSPAYETIILGDSRALAVNFHAEEKEDIYNYSFANSGGMYPYVYFLKNYLKHQEKPKQILWSFIPLMLTDTWEIFKISPSGNSAEVYRASKLFSITDMISLEKNSIFYQYPRVSRSLIEKKLYIDAVSIGKYFSESYDIENNKQLFNQKTGGLLYSKDVSWRYNKNTYLETTEFNISDQEINFVEKFLKIAKNNNIKIYLFNMPIPETIYKKREEKLFYEKYFSVMDALKEKYPETLFIYKKIIAYRGSFFIDGSHLNSPGAHYFQNHDYGEIMAWIADHE